MQIEGIQWGPKTDQGPTYLGLPMYHRYIKMITG